MTGGAAGAGGAGATGGTEGTGVGGAGGTGGTGGPGRTGRTGGAGSWRGWGGGGNWNGPQQGWGEHLHREPLASRVPLPVCTARGYSAHHHPNEEVLVSWGCYITEGHRAGS